MQFISIQSNTKLKDLIKSLGVENTQSILSANDLSWSPNVGKQFSQKCEQIKQSTGKVDYQRKATILNRYLQNQDIFEKAAIASEDEWKVISVMGTFEGMLRVPDDVILPDSAGVLGSEDSVSNTVYNAAMSQLYTPPLHTIDPSIFNEYSSTASSIQVDQGNSSYNGSSYNAMQWFCIPWGEVTLHSSLDNTSIDFPCYPENISDSKKANYSQMPQLLYQYEPWQVYESSGPRSNTYKFDIHRHMWSGDHSDGKANELIRFCEAHCYPRFNGSMVNVSVATLYVHGNPLIRGVITSVETDWDGPIADDGFYLHCSLSITITEVSDTPLNYDTIKAKPLIG